MCKGDYVKPLTIEERAKALGLSVVKTTTEWLISDDVHGEILRGFHSRRAVAKWLDKPRRLRVSYVVRNAKKEGG